MACHPLIDSQTHGSRQEHQGHGGDGGSAQGMGNGRSCTLPWSIGVICFAARKGSRRWEISIFIAAFEQFANLANLASGLMSDARDRGRCQSSIVMDRIDESRRAARRPSWRGNGINLYCVRHEYFVAPRVSCIASSAGRGTVRTWYVYPYFGYRRWKEVINGFPMHADCKPPAKSAKSHLLNLVITLHTEIYLASF